jgi:hypothetical protein
MAAIIKDLDLNPNLCDSRVSLSYFHPHSLCIVEKKGNEQ